MGGGGWFYVPKVRRSIISTKHDLQFCYYYIFDSQLDFYFSTLPPLPIDNISYH